MSVYYNEFEPYAAQWLRNLISAGHIPAGDVDERSITEVSPDDLRPYTQAHFFAGIGGWPLALRMAGWDDTRPVWTGSCPCQPFSTAGFQQGKNDQRHLWPVWFRLIQAARPATVFGEQVASAITMGISDEEMFCVFNGETPIGVQEIWGQIKGWSAASMQAMSAHVREEVAVAVNGLSASAAAEAQKRGRSISDSLYREEQSSLFDFKDKEPVQEEGDSLRPRFVRARNISPDFIDAVRNYWLSLAGRAWEARLQQSIHRQNRPGEGVCLQQYQDSLLCHQRGDGELGAGENGNYHQALEEILNDIRGIARKTGTRFTGKTSFGWLDETFHDLEGENYTCGAAVLPACSVGAAHRRDRLWFVANADVERQSQPEGVIGEQREWIGDRSQACSTLGDTIQSGLERYAGHEQGRPGWSGANGSVTAPDPFADLEWIDCPDGKTRPVKSGVRLLAHGVPARVGKLRAFGNAIDPRVAAEFIKAYMSLMP